MKAKSYFHHPTAVLYLCVAVAIAGLVGCGENEDPVIPQPPVVDPANGDVSFVISNESGSGTGTTDSPAEVKKGETLNMVISQKSKYTDSDGTVFECEPKAQIELFAKLDTVYAKHKDQLTSVQEKSEVTSSHSGSNPVRNAINQKFLIGEQDVIFDLAYEVYNYVTKANKTVEMPYIKLNQANFGNSSATEESSGTNTRASLSKPVVTLKPLVQTRATVSDTVLYEVNVLFNLDIESVNTKEENKKNLVFSVNYIGAVVTTTEIPDPDNGEISFVISNENGSGSGTAESPAVVQKGETLNMVINQKSKYTDIDWSIFECEPKATINLFAKLDTVFATDASQLVSVQQTSEVTSSQSGDNPVLHSVGQRFQIGEQDVVFDLAYEVYNYVTKSNETVEMPYIKLKQADLGESSAKEGEAGTRSRSINWQPVVTLKPLTQTRATVSDTVLYEVNVLFNLDIESVNTKEENKQTLVFSVNYIGAVVATTEIPDPELEKVEYRTDYFWEEAHDNLPLLYYAVVFRDRYYSNGEVLTDRFIDLGHPGELNSYTGSTDNYPFAIERTEERNDSVWISYAKTKVDNVAELKISYEKEEKKPGNWDTYVTSKLYSEDLSLGEGASVAGDYAETSRQNGWYFYCFFHSLTIYVEWEGGILALYNSSRMYDQFLAIDGRIIDFLKYKPVRQFNHYVEDISGTTPGKRIVSECTTLYLGRKFYTKTVLELYNNE